MPIDHSREPDLLRAARVSLGALGIATTLELRLLPAYRLHQRVWRCPVQQALDGFEERADAHRHFEFFYFPSHDFAECKAIDATEAPPGVLPGRDEERIDWSARLLPSERELRFHEMEYAVPAGYGPACFRAVAERVRARHPDVVWPLEYRTVAADDAMLSPATGRDTVTISVHRDGRRPHEAVFRDVEPLFWDYGGRPHWGKFHSLRAASLAPLYPEWEAFQALRRRLDPDGVFLNPYLRELLGA